MMNELVHDGLKRGVLDMQNHYILTAGDPLGVEGSTNMIRIISHHEMEYFKSLKLNKPTDTDN
jgi:pyruvate kinase